MKNLNDLFEHLVVTKVWSDSLHDDTMDYFADDFEASIWSRLTREFSTAEMGASQHPEMINLRQLSEFDDI